MYNWKVCRTKYQHMQQKINEAMQKELKDLKRHAGTMTIANMRLDNLEESDRPPVHKADLLSSPIAQLYLVSREHYGGSAGVVLAAFGVGMDIHFYAAGFISEISSPGKRTKPLIWSKIAVADEAEANLSPRGLSVIVDGLKSKLAHAVRNLARP